MQPSNALFSISMTLLRMVTEVRHERHLRMSSDFVVPNPATLCMCQFHLHYNPVVELAVACGYVNINCFCLCWIVPSRKQLGMSPLMVLYCELSTIITNPIPQLNVSNISCLHVPMPIMNSYAEGIFHAPVYTVRVLSVGNSSCNTFGERSCV